MVAGVLSQKYIKYWLLIVFFLKIINSAEYNYQIYDKEILVIIKSLEE
jgi:hypothetical protein